MDLGKSLDTDLIIMAVFILWNKGHFVIISERPEAPLEKTGVAECWLNVPDCDYDKCDLSEI